MSNKSALMAPDRTLVDITGNSSYIGGINVLFPGDFRQTFLVIAKELQRMRFAHA